MARRGPLDGPASHVRRVGGAAGDLPDRGAHLLGAGRGRGDPGAHVAGHRGRRGLALRGDDVVDAVGDAGDAVVDQLADVGPRGIGERAALPHADAHQRDARRRDAGDRECDRLGPDPRRRAELPRSSSTAVHRLREISAAAVAQSWTEASVKASGRPAPGGQLTGPPGGLEGVKVTGSSRRPRSTPPPVQRSWSTGTSRARSGSRPSSAVNATCASSRASGAPRQ